MTTIAKTTAWILLLFAAQITYGQNNKEKAFAKAQEAVQLMDKGKVDESITLLEEAQKLDPERYIYPYELAYAYYLKQDYKKAVKILEKNKGHKNVEALLFQLLGNSYDMLGKPEKAVETYDAGLQKFPNTGILYLEKGNLFWAKKEYAEALSFYEKGIEVEPAFASNYYRAARIYCNSSEEVWGMIYGEIFLNLERNTPRTAEISELLFETYKSEIKFVNDTTSSVSFCQQMTMNISSLGSGKQFQLPFGMVYESALMFTVINEKGININSLNRIRTRFLETYFKNGSNATHPNLLFDYQEKVRQAGHLEAYNYWVLMKGDLEGFQIWQEANSEKWNSFVKWFNENVMLVDNEHKFHSQQY